MSETHRLIKNQTYLVVAIEYDPAVEFALRLLRRERIPFQAFLGAEYGGHQRASEQILICKDLTRPNGASESLWAKFVLPIYQSHIRQLLSSNTAQSVIALNATQTRSAVRSVGGKPLWLRPLIHKIADPNPPHATIAEAQVRAGAQQARSVLIIGGSREIGRSFAALRACQQLRLSGHLAPIHWIPFEDEFLANLDILRRVWSMPLTIHQTPSPQKIEKLLGQAQNAILSGEGVDARQWISMAPKIHWIVPFHAGVETAQTIQVDICDYQQISMALLQTQKAGFQLASPDAARLRMRLRLSTGLGFPKFTNSELSRIFLPPIRERSRALSLCQMSYQNRLISGVEPKTEYEKFIQGIRMNKTHFFRQFTSLRRTLVRFRASPPPTLNILCLGCSTGEEAYTLSIMARKILPTVKVKIQAWDQNRALIEFAKYGAYPRSGLRHFPKEYRSPDLFDSSCSGQRLFRFSREVRQTVQFFNANFLIDQPRQRFHLIVCRNVLYYFDPSAQNSFWQRAKGWLNPEGCVVVGRRDPKPQPDWLRLAETDQTYQTRFPVQKTKPLMETFLNSPK